VPQDNVVELDLSIPLARKIILEICADTSRVFISTHAEKKMMQRDITRSQVMRCLRSGAITEGPARGIKGNWELTMNVLSAGDSVTVVAALDNDENGNHILVITAY